MIKSCLIMGSGRSGTSLLAGLFRNAGYFMGETLIPPNESNPKGFFEDREINGINEVLLRGVLPRRPPILDRWILRERLGDGHRWLARLPVGTRIRAPRREIERIRLATSRRPFCFKDPRFAYTLPVWRPFLGDAVFLCVFRHPAVTARSIHKECRVAPYLQNLRISLDDALDVWIHVYRQILQVHRHEGEWLFIHYDQIVSGEAIESISRFTGAQLDESFPDLTLKRSRADSPVTDEARHLYDELCQLAEFVPVTSDGRAGSEETPSGSASDTAAG